MSQPPTPPVDGPAPFPQPEVPAEPFAAAPEPAMEWTVQSPPSWSQPWAPPTGPALPGSALPGSPPKGTGKPTNRTVLVLVAVAAALAGAVAAGFIVTAVFLSGAKDIGQEIGIALAPAVEDSVSDGISQGMEDGMGQAMEDAMSYAEEGITSEEYAPAGPTEQFPAVEPGVLGPDPVLDAYAGSCFGGDLQACDNLFYEAPPLSDYEEYAATCGGRVKAYAAMNCTELD